MTIAEINETITHRVKYIQLENERSDWRAGLISSTIANVNRDPKKRKKPYTPQDFMPQEAKEKKPMTVEESYQFLYAMTVAQGGEVPK